MKLCSWSFSMAAVFCAVVSSPLYSYHWVTKCNIFALPVIVVVCMHVPKAMRWLNKALRDVSHVNCTFHTFMSFSLHHSLFLFSAHHIVLLSHPHWLPFNTTFIFFKFCCLAHEGSAGFSWDLSTSSVQPAGPDRFLPGAWAQRRAPNFLLRSEGPFECLWPDWDQPW